MAEIKLQRTLYKYRSNQALYIRLSPVFLLSVLALLFRPEFLAKLRVSWIGCLTLTETEPGRHELSSLRDIDFRLFVKTLKLTPNELIFIVLTLLVLLYTVVLMSCIWSSGFKLCFFYDRCRFKEGTPGFSDFLTNRATHIFINELVLDTNFLTVNRTNRVLLPLYRTGFIYYIHDYKKFVFRVESGRFEPVEHFDEVQVPKVLSWQGLLSISEGVEKISGLEPNLNVCADLFGPNDYEIPRCSFWKMLLEAFLAPFFVFQLTSTLLWIFDDYLYYSLISIFSLVMIEVQTVYKRILEYNRINSMKLPPFQIYVFRDHKWQVTHTNLLYPGDIIFITTSTIDSGASVKGKGAGVKNTSVGSSVKNTSVSGSVKNVVTKNTGGGEDILICPCDCLILDGEVIVDESILTGESVPQFKTSVEDNSVNQRNSTIFSGTSIIVTRNVAVTGTPASATLLKNVHYKGIEKLIPNGSVCLVIRTGFESYQGRLVHSILNSDPNKVVGSNTQGYMFLFLLMLFAVSAVVFVVRNSNYKSLKKLLLVSSRILVSVIPPEFPVTISMAVTIGLIQLRKKGIYCTAPNRLPLAANIDVIAFDKTGTLTQDQMYLNGLYYSDSVNRGLSGGGSPDKSLARGSVDKSLSKSSSDQRLDKGLDDPVMHYYSKLVIAGCHSLTFVNGAITGDPMEKISFTYFNNQIDTTNNNIIYLNNLPEGNVTLKILKRWRFTSELGRMSTISSVTPNNASHTTIHPGGSVRGELLLLTKGSPEKIKLLLRVVPSYFDEVCHDLTIKGLRVLCLAYKRLYDIPVNALITIDRTIVEKDLEFCGFLALEAPIKKSSKQCMKRLKNFKKIMITGDNILTACYVTQQINMVNDKTTCPINFSQKNKHGFGRKYGLFSRKHSLFGGKHTLFGGSGMTIKEYLKNYNYELNDECPISNVKMETIKKCPIYKETSCPFLQKSENNPSYIQRCPLNQSLSSNTGSSFGGSVSHRNSYKKFLESCPFKQYSNLASTNTNSGSVNAGSVSNSGVRNTTNTSSTEENLIPTTTHTPSTSTTATKTTAASKTTVPPVSRCPISYMTRKLWTMYMLFLKVLFPYYYHVYYGMTETEDCEDCSDGDNFAILSYSKGNFVWKKRNGEDFFPNSTTKQLIHNMYRLIPNHILSITGNILQLLLNNNSTNSNTNTPISTPNTSASPSGEEIQLTDLIMIINNCNVFARMSPQQKEFIIKCYKLNNKTIAMCGDGTNDISALKQADIGISLLNIIHKEDKSKPDLLMDNELPSIKLGEASIASPFTYHGSDVNCVFNLIKSGRCSLYNLFMLYKLMGINSLITALGMSVLALDGVNFSDAQTTLYSVLYTYLVISLNKSKGIDVSSDKKPEKSIFSPCNFMSLVLQILVHSYFLIYVWNLGKLYRSADYKGFFDMDFEPNVVNTLLYYVWYAISLNSFVSNYVDYPYMDTISNNKFLFKPILLSYFTLLLFISDLVKPLNSFFSLVPISHMLKLKISLVVLFDLALTFVISKAINFFYYSLD
ncbi:HAD ATPase P-type family IC family protein [Theileria parva strain Muguga]|uniref:Integral membrane protein, putative n=1 Tax=Theileria parva TaxID=5875 RepID=Q4MZX9_THEPA|nr:HAD ATPase P-type family IC family protein [Theileria parva strain Muguga]EAN31112.1 HAD ATPase P-type family IC family protein [Theileria parva strain Muguga]|eukprot:XP_763395.1 integral membrane protein [Theileria parva strain Muguga]